MLLPTADEFAIMLHNVFHPDASDLNAEDNYSHHQAHDPYHKMHSVLVPLKSAFKIAQKCHIVFF